MPSFPLCLAAFYTASGVDTDVHHGKIAVRYNRDGTVAEYNKKRESKIFNGKEFILEEAMTADYALIKAWKGDKLGNLVFRGTARNFNPDMAKSEPCEFFPSKVPCRLLSTRIMVLRPYS